jgi:hypothetical protein
VVFSFTLVIVTAEDSGHLADRPAQYGAEVWTDEAIGSLPPQSVLLVRSEPVAWRLWAAAIARGERPDVVVVPLSLLDRGSIAAHLLQAEPALAPLIREVAISGAPSEFALSTLADARPLYVEFDSAWDNRLMDHLLPHPFWMRFEPHAVGRSDREATLHTARDAFRRVLAVADSPDGRDRGTLAMLSARAREQAALLAALGDRDAVANISDDLRSAQLAKPFLTELDRRLADTRRGRIDITGLLP